MASSGDKNRKDVEWGEPVVKGSLKAVEKTIERAAKPMVRNAPKWGRVVMKSIPGAPGYVLDAVEIVRGKDPLREAIGFGGSLIGGAAGGGMGLATGPAAPVAVPFGAAVGSVAGEQFAESVYDDNHEAVRKRIEETKAWMRDRNADVARATWQIMAPVMPPLMRRR